MIINRGQVVEALNALGIEPNRTVEVTLGVNDVKIEQYVTDENDRLVLIAGSHEIARRVIRTTVQDSPAPEPSMPRTLSEALNDPALAAITALPDAAPKAKQHWGITHLGGPPVRVSTREIGERAVRECTTGKCLLMSFNPVTGAWEPAE